MDIVIIDDHVLFSSSLIELLSVVNDSLIVSSFSSYSSAQAALKRTLPKLILLDLNLGEECGVELSKVIAMEFPETKVAILSANEDLEVMCTCAMNGVVGYITKSAPPDTFIKAVQLLLEDGSYFPSYLLPALLKKHVNAETAVPKVEDPSLVSGLTPRQREVLGYLKQGMSNKLIAHNMNISEGTVKLHVSTVLNKLGVSNRSEAIVKVSV